MDPDMVKVKFITLPRKMQIAHVMSYRVYVKEHPVGEGNHFSSDTHGKAIQLHLCVTNLKRFNHAIIVPCN